MDEIYRVPSTGRNAAQLQFDRWSAGRFPSTEDLAYRLVFGYAHRFDFCPWRRVENVQQIGFGTANVNAGYGRALDFVLDGVINALGEVAVAIEKLLRPA
ncbi:hypothetical protein [Paraburkholderia oxyphila]|uniref:hypothetical protein n=1 Tax=Paraburkholderia oxyphila TaxID=614212 RepID=UPI000489D735|nr:hypothetical protein [Paraburkholderia oxyphila]